MLHVLRSGEQDEGKKKKEKRLKLVMTDDQRFLDGEEVSSICSLIFNHLRNACVCVCVCVCVCMCLCVLEGSSGWMGDVGGWGDNEI